MVLTDSACPLGTGQEVVCRKNTFLCQEELISRNRQLFKVIVESFILEIFKNKADKYIPGVLGYTSPDWGNCLAPLLCPCAYFLPSMRRVWRKAVGIYRECTCLMVLRQPRSQRLA